MPTQCFLYDYCDITGSQAEPTKVKVWKGVLSTVRRALCPKHDIVIIVAPDAVVYMIV